MVDLLSSERTQMDEDREKLLAVNRCSMTVHHLHPTCRGLARWRCIHSPVAPAGDPYGLDDVNHHLEEKDKEEEEEAEGAVRPEEEKHTKGWDISI